MMEAEYYILERDEEACIKKLNILSSPLKELQDYLQEYLEFYRDSSMKIYKMTISIEEVIPHQN